MSSLEALKILKENPELVARPILGSPRVLLFFGASNKTNGAKFRALIEYINWEIRRADTAFKPEDYLLEWDIFPNPKNLITPNGE